MESRKRSLAKSISWQILHMTVVAGVAFLITGEWEIAGLLAILELFWETAAFYLHERAWARWGKKIK
jgi:uncharacterized membrane protein